MAERNARKDRACSLCGEHVFGKASKLKEHGDECKKTHELAAAAALMQKIHKDMATDEFNLQKLAYDAAAQEGAKQADRRFVDMADPKVTDAEGD